MAELFDQRAWKRRDVPACSLLQCVRHSGNLVLPGSGRDATTAGPLTARQEEAGRARVPCKSC